MNLNGLTGNIEQYFSDLRFEGSSHTYKVNSKPHEAVSRVIDSFVDKVDFDTIAGYIAIRDNRVKEDILQEWATINKIAIDKGTRVHKFAEGDMSFPSIGEEKAVVKFWGELDQDRYKVIGKEVKMYHKDFGYAGTDDLMLWDTWTSTLVIADYKTNGDLFKNFGGKLLAEPFDFLEDSPYNKYQIQLSLYQILIEQLGITVSERWVVWLTSDGEYKILKTYDLTKILREWLNMNLN